MYIYVVSSHRLATNQIIFARLLEYVFNSSNVCFSALFSAAISVSWFSSLSQRLFNPDRTSLSLESSVTSTVNFMSCIILGLNAATIACMCHLINSCRLSQVFTPSVSVETIPAWSFLSFFWPDMAIHYGRYFLPSHWYT